MCAHSLTFYHRSTPATLSISFSRFLRVSRSRSLSSPFSLRFLLSLPALSPPPPLSSPSSLLSLPRGTRARPSTCYPSPPRAGNEPRRGSFACATQPRCRPSLGRPPPHRDTRDKAGPAHASPANPSRVRRSDPSASQHARVCPSCCPRPHTQRESESIRVHRVIPPPPSSPHTRSGNGVGPGGATCLSAGLPRLTCLHTLNLRCAFSLSPFPLSLPFPPSLSSEREEECFYIGLFSLRSLRSKKRRR
jgi:hypothetical protein